MSEKLEYADFLESGAYVKKLEETYNRYLDIRDKKLVEFMEENKRLHSIIKEVREYIKKYRTMVDGYEDEKTGQMIYEHRLKLNKHQVRKLLEILDGVD